ncbi:MAG: M43 family zinc metalloprotease, partial [Bacteroidota bacterium]|nr:M43 family zinc metalloprotease [Bacteroidota bacterium]
MKNRPALAFLSCLSFLLIFLLCIVSAGAQTAPTKLIRCGTMEMYEDVFRTNAKFRQQFFENQILLSRSGANTANNQQFINDTIAVVIHVIGSAAMQAEVTDAVLQSQIDVLNEDYQGKNADSVRIPAAFKNVYGKSNIVFMLAAQNQYGEPASGIERRTNDVTYTSSIFNNAKLTSMGGMDAWDPNQFLNIWVVSFGTTGLLGISIFPGDPSPLHMHGFVSDYRSFGRGASYLYPKYNMGRTTTHELGHFFNLRHIWGDNNGDCFSNDFPGSPTGEDDTPTQANPTYDNPDISGTGVVKTDACSPNSPGIMYQNFMDYTDDVAMALFTKGQQLRMERALTISPDRLNLLNSQTYLSVPTRLLDARVRQINNPKNGNLLCTPAFTPTVTIRNSGTTTLTNLNIVIILNGGTPVVQPWTGSLASYSETTVTLPSLTAADGLNTILVYTQNPNGGADEMPGNDAQEIQFTVGGITESVTESFEGTQFPPASWQVVNEDESMTWTKANTAAHTGTSSATMNLWNYLAHGKRDGLRTPNIKFSSADSAYIDFWVAHARYATVNDSLIVKVSMNCGDTWTRVFAKGSNTLKTTTAVTPGSSAYGFVPAENEWRKESLNLTPFINNGQLMVEFETYNAFGDNIFIDDVSLKAVQYFPLDARLTSVNKPLHRLCASL